MFETSQTTVIFSGRFVQVRSYGCDIACRPVPLEKSCRWHSVMFMRDGRFVRTVRGEATLIDRNHVGFFNRDEVYTVCHPDTRGDGVTEIEILPEVLAEIAVANDVRVEDPLTRPFASTHGLIGSRAYQVHWEIWRAAQQGNEPLALEETALRLAAHAIRGAATVAANFAGEAAAPRRPDTRRVHAALAHEVKVMLSTRYREALDLDAIATAVHASPYHLCRVFKTETGASIHAYLRRLRLRAGLGALADRRTDLPRLALGLGFSSQSHFCDAFRREFGRTPSSARRAPGAAGLREMSKILEDRLVA